MANLSEFSIIIKGDSKEKLNVFFETFMYAECYTKEYKTINGNEYLFMSGECKGSINRGNNTINKNDIDLRDLSKNNDELLNLNLLSKSKILQCEIEAFEYAEDADGYINHYRYNNGEIVIEEEIDLREAKNIEYECDEDSSGEKINFRDLIFDKAFKLGTNQEKFVDDKIVKEEYEMDTNPNNFIVENGILVEYTGDSESIKIPEGVTEIDEDAFYHGYKFKKIRKIQLPSTLEFIPENGFADFKLLEELDIPNPRIPYYGDNMLGCNYYESSQPKIMKNKFVICGEALFFYNGDEEEVVVPSGIKVIREYAFSYYNNVKKVILPDSLEYICSKAFDHCNNLEEVIVPNGIKSIEEKAFNECPKLVNYN